MNGSTTEKEDEYNLFAAWQQIFVATTDSDITGVKRKEKKLKK
jgi:hypothetical protein